MVLMAWLRSALPDKPFIYHSRTARQGPGRDHIYASLVESIKVEQWRELGTLPNLQHLGPERDRPLDDSLAAAKPIVLDAFRPPITIIPHVPFTAATLRDNAIRLCENYTPDYTVFKGCIEADPYLLDDHRASLLVGDIKLLGPEGAKDPVDHTTSLSWSALGQLLWYCVSRKTSLGFYMSDHELVLMEFVVGREDGITALGDAPPLNKRKYTNSSTTTSTVSPSDRHKQKRNTAPAEPADSGESPISSPTLPSGAPEQPNHRLTSSSPTRQGQQSKETSPRTPEPQFKHPEYSSSSYMPSSPGEISAETLKNLAPAGCDFTYLGDHYCIGNQDAFSESLDSRATPATDLFPSILGLPVSASSKPYGALL
ncbi:hypothetical protein DL767_006697 [Monosporascus sp. MG133]|nr:hypothetical protein DL767_006697 [Monosporascus sp. MG133]